MPEGPEVYVIASQLNKLLCSEKNLELIEVVEYPNAKIYNAELLIAGLKLDKVYSHGKKIIFVLFSEDKENIYIVSSLGMTGSWGASEQAGKYTLVTFTFNNINIHYEDTRRFGDIAVYNENDFRQFISTLGPCLLTNMPNKKEWLDIFNKKKNKNIAAFLIDQKIIAGIGNYLRADILFVARISPERKVGSLNSDEIELLRNTSKNIMKESVSYGGNTIKNYKTLNGSPGTYQVKIYGKNEITVDELTYQVSKKKIAGSQNVFYCDLQL